MNYRVLMWLVLSLSLMLTASIFIAFAIFPLFNSSWFILVVSGLLMFFTSGFLLLSARLRKVKKKLHYLLYFLVTLIVPIVFAVFEVVPYVNSAIAWLYVLMHFVFATGAIIIYSQKSKLNQLF